MNEDPEYLYQTVCIKHQCPQCGQPVEQLDKDTSSGREVHFYTCTVCAWSGFVDAGVALWVAYSEATKKKGNK